MRGHTGEGMEGTEDEWGSRNNWLEISRRGRMEKFGFWEKIRDLEARIWAFFFIFAKVAPTQRDLDLTSADAQTKSNTARYVTGFVTDFACPVFSKGHQPSMVLATPPPLQFILVRWNCEIVEWVTSKRFELLAREKGGGKKINVGLSLSFVSIYFNAEISKIFARGFFPFFFFLLFPRNIRNVFAEKGFPKIKFKLSSETSYFLRKIARKSYSSMRGGFLTGIMS